MHFATSSPAEGVTVVAFPANALGGEQGVALATILTTEVTTSTTTVVLDLSAVQVMNSTGLGMLVSSLATVGRAGASLFLVGVPDRVKQLLEMTRLVDVFQIRNSVSDIVSAQS